MRRVACSSGQRFGRLVVIGEAEPLRYDYPSGKMTVDRRIICRCDCGNATTVSLGHARRGRSLSCGCLRQEITGRRARTHGGSGSSEYNIWKTMMQRCDKPSCADYPNYGGRGITVCRRWRESFEAFLADMGPRPSLKHSIDRYPDNDGNYEPSNCRWATAREQRMNQRGTRRAAA